MRTIVLGLAVTAAIALGVPGLTSRPAEAGRKPVPKADLALAEVPADWTKPTAVSPLFMTVQSVQTIQYRDGWRERRREEWRRREWERRRRAEWRRRHYR